MWERFYELLSRVFKLTITVELHDKQIEKLNEEVKELNRLYRDLIIAINRVGDRQEFGTRKGFSFGGKSIIKI